MPTVTFSHEVIRRLQLNADITYFPKDWEDRLGLIGCSVEECNDETIEID